MNSLLEGIAYIPDKIFETVGVSLTFADLLDKVLFVTGNVIMLFILLALLGALLGMFGK